MRCPLSLLLFLGSLGQCLTPPATPASNTTSSANESPSLGAPLSPVDHPDISLQLRPGERTRLEAGKVIHNCLHVMFAGWMTAPPYPIGGTIRLADRLRAWSQAVQVTPAPGRTTALTTQLLAYAAGDIIDDLWSRYAEEATVFGVCPYQIREKWTRRAIADWDFVQLPPPPPPGGDDDDGSGGGGGGGDGNSTTGLLIQYIGSNSSSSSVEDDDDPAVAVSKRQSTAAGGMRSSSSGSTNTREIDSNSNNNNNPVNLTLPTDPGGILVRFQFSTTQHLAPKSLLSLPAQLLRTLIFPFPPRSRVSAAGFGPGARWMLCRVSYGGRRHCVRLTVLDAGVEWYDLGLAVMGLLVPPVEQARWDGYVAEFTLRDGGGGGGAGGMFARVEMWEWEDGDGNGNGTVPTTGVVEVGR